MRFVLLFFLVTLSFAASAQWYRIDLKLKKKNHDRFPLISQTIDHSMKRLPVITINTKVKIQPFELDHSEYSYEAAEYFVIKKAQHNMRFRIYTEASYNFSELAQLYIRQNRFSEAKWYLLQSNNLSRQQNDNKHTISNLIDLAMVKANTGEFLLARQDLAEAHDIASNKGFSDALPGIEEKMQFLQQNKAWPQKAELGLSSAAITNNKIE